MGLFDSLKASIGQLAESEAGALIGPALSAAGLGSLQSVVNQLQRRWARPAGAGLGQRQTAGQPISADQLSAIVNSEQVQQLAQHFGVDPDCRRSNSSPSICRRSSPARPRMASSRPRIELRQRSANVRRCYVQAPVPNAALTYAAMSLSSPRPPFPCEPRAVPRRSRSAGQRSISTRPGTCRPRANGSQTGNLLHPEHPPLAKLLIAASVGLFGDTPFGWRGAERRCSARSR